MRSRVTSPASWIVPAAVWAALLAGASSSYAQAGPKKGEAQPAAKKAAEPPRKAAEDVVRMRDGTEVRGQVTRIDADSVACTDESGKGQALRGADVVDIALADAPSGLLEGDRAFAARDWGKAAAQYQKALDDVAQKKCRDFHKPVLYLKLARAHRAGGNFESALGILKKLRDECGNSRQRRDAYVEALEIARGKKDEAGVSQLLGDMKKETGPLRDEAEIEIARDLYTRGNFAEARQAFGRLISRPASLGAEAKLWHLRCLRELKNDAELETACKAVLGDPASSTPALRQAANVSLGMMLWAKAQSDKTQIRESLQAFRRAVAVGPPPKEESPDDYALALLEAGRCHLLLARATSVPEGKQELQAIATGYLTELTRYYRSTSWGKDAAKELASLASGGKGEASKEAPKEEAKEEGKEPAKEGANQ